MYNMYIYIYTYQGEMSDCMTHDMPKKMSTHVEVYAGLNLINVTISTCHHVVRMWFTVGTTRCEVYNSICDM